MKDNNWHISKKPTIRSVLAGIERDIRTVRASSGSFNLYFDSMGHHAIRKALGMKGKPRLN